MKKSLIAIFLPVMLLSCAKDQVTEQETVLDETQKENCFVEGQMTVQLSEELAAAIEQGGLAATKASGLPSMLDALGVEKFERLYPDAGEWEPRHREAGLHRWYRVVYDPSAGPLTKAQSGLENVEGVVFCEPVRKKMNTAVFNDPYFSYQWHYYNDGSAGTKYMAGADINVVPVWENYTAGSSDVIVAVIDEGVDLAHEDLAANCIPAGVQGSKCFVYDCAGYIIYPDDHGSHVAGTIAAVNDNGKGGCGIAGGDGKTSGVRIMSCQILHEDPEDPKSTLQGDEYNALVWAADHGAVIAQNSWGFTYESEEEAAAGGVGSVGPAIEYFNKYAGCDKDGNQLADSPMKGGVVFFAAGNEGWSHAWPAEYEGVIAVGAMNSMMRKSYYSNYGPWVDICAPGGDAYVDSMILSCAADNKYGFMQGTSMACPHVSGVAALIASWFGGPGFTREMLIDRLLDGANYDTALKGQDIGPLVDALGSFTSGDTEAPESVSDFTASAKSNNVTLTWKATADNVDGKAYAYLLLMSQDKSLIESPDPKNLPSSVRTMIVKGEGVEVGEELSGQVQDLEFDSDYYCSIIAYDYASNYSAPSPVKKVHTEKNNPPVVETDYTGNYEVRPFETLRVNYRVSDPDGHVFDVEAEPGSTAASFSSSEGGASQTLTIVGKSAPAGSYTAHIVAKDVYGAANDFVIEYKILENHPPKTVADIENILIGSTGESVVLDMDKYFYDEDGEQLQYTFEYSSQSVAHCLQKDNTVTLTSMSYGVTEITVTATDACGKSCSLAFKVAVRDASVPVSLYPNPVSTVLNVSTAEEYSASIRVVSKAGATVAEVSQNVSPFDPVVIDMSDCAAGVYSVVFKGGSIDERYTVVKK